MKARYLHYWVGLLLIAAALPTLRSLHIPIRFDWTSLVFRWFALAAQSIVVAALLCLIGPPKQSAFGPLVSGYRRHPLRIAFHLLYFVILVAVVGWMRALTLTVGTIAVLELRERKKLRKLIEILPPAIYLFAGFLLVFAYNDIIVSVRYNFAYDPVFNAMDKRLLHGWSICDMSQWAVQSFPASFFQFLQSIYFGMFLQIGAAIILVTLYDRKQRGLQFVGTILLAYYFALGILYLWPAQGPYYLCPPHFSQLPVTSSLQNSLVAHAQALWNHVPVLRISTDYFIAFPCLHIAQPLIVMWFLRRWRRVVVILCAYDAILIVSILLLEWHYLVDIIGGVLVAGVVILITDGSAVRNLWTKQACAEASPSS